MHSFYSNRTVTKSTHPIRKFCYTALLLAMTTFAVTACSDPNSAPNDTDSAQSTNTVDSTDTADTTANSGAGEVR